MTSQEEQLLKGLADRVNGTQLQEKDPEAEQFIQQNIGSNPDALYILAQTVLVQEYALNQARRQIADLRTQLQEAQQQQQQPKHSGSFLGNLLGHKDEPQRTAPPPPPPQRPPVAPQATDPVSGVGPGLAYPTGGYPVPGAPVGYGAPQGGGFMRSALQTATGVAAGALAFEGIESLLHGFGGHSGFGGGFGGPGYVEERPEVVNNYYGDAAGHEHTGLTDAGKDFADSQGPEHTPLESDHNTGLNEGSYLGGGASDRDDLAATGDRDQDAKGVGDDNVDYSADSDDSVTSDDVADDGAYGSDDGGVDDSGGDFGGGGDDFSGGDDGGGF
jgi:hypothetical protein